MTPGTPGFTWHQLCAVCIPSKNHGSQHREGADWEYLTFKPQQPELETVIQREDLRGCSQQTHSWLHSQFHTQPCKSCQTAALESHPYTPCSRGMGAHSISGGWPVRPPQPPAAVQSHRGGEGTDLKPAGDAFPHFPVPLLPQGSVTCWESPSTAGNQGIVSQKREVRLSSPALSCC